MHGTWLRKKIPLLPLFYLLLLFLLFVQQSLYARCFISELYRDPPGSEGQAGGGSTHEFIEIVNIGRDTVSLDSLYVTNGDESDSIVSVRTPIPGCDACRYAVTALLPGQIAVILDADYRTWCETHEDKRFTFPDSTALLECGDREFGSNGLAADHGVFIYRGSKNRIDTIICSAADPSTVLQTPTAEIVRLSEPVNIEGFSVNAAGILSGAPFFDYAADSIDPGIYTPLRGGWLLEYQFRRYDPDTKTAVCSLFIQCLTDACGSAVQWCLERNSGNGFTPAVSGAIDLHAGYGTGGATLNIDSVQLRLRLAPPPAPLRGDAPLWNIDWSSLWLPDHSLRITELFPRATANEPEWIELHNCAAVPVNLKNWRICASADTMVVARTETIIQPGTFMVIGRRGATLMAKYRYLFSVCEPDRWASFDNSSDTITLLDRAGVVHETVCYDAKRFASWPSVSLVRSGDGDGCGDGWKVADRSTPGIPAGRGAAENQTAPVLDIGPIPFTPDNDGHDDVLAIRLSVPLPAVTKVTIYGFDGRLQRTFPEVTSDIVYWDGSGSDGPLPPGPFFVIAEITGGKNVIRLRKKGIVWRK
jgi:hypothetical protein